MPRRLLIISCFVLLACGLSAAANNPFEGTWRINDVKSSWSNGKFPKNMSLTIKLSFSGDEIKYDSVNDTVKGRSPAKLDYVAKMDGEPHPLPNSTRFNQVSVRQLPNNEMQILESKNGDVIVGAIWEVSRDGRHMVRRGIGKAADGTSHAYEEFFDKQ